MNNSCILKNLRIIHIKNIQFHNWQQWICEIFFTFSHGCRFRNIHQLGLAHLNFNGIQIPRGPRWIIFKPHKCRHNWHHALLLFDYLSAMQLVTWNPDQFVHCSGDSEIRPVKIQSFRRSDFKWSGSSPNHMKTGQLYGYRTFSCYLYISKK